MIKFEEKIIDYGNEFTLQLITKDYVYYCNISECDNNTNTIMMNKEKNILSSNIFAYDSFIEELKADNWEYIGKETFQAVNNGFLED